MNIPNENDKRSKINKPNIPAIEKLESLLKEIENLEYEIQKVKDKINDIPQDASTQVDSERERMDIASYLYWMTPIQDEAIRKWLLDEDKSKFRQIKAITVEEYCVSCKKNKIMHINSRHEMKALQSHHHAVCDECKKTFRNANRSRLSQ